MTLFIVGIIGIIFLLLTAVVAVSLIFLILGIVKHRKDKVTSLVFIAFALVTLLGMAVGGFLLLGPKKVKVETPDGDVRIWNNIIEDYLNNVANDNFDEVEEMLEEEPALVYAYDDDGEDILQNAALNGNIEMLELAIEYGAKFDSEIIFDESSYDCSIQAFLDEIGRRSKRYDLTDEDVYDVIEFMLKNDASVEIDDEDSPNALFLAYVWICHDEIISDEDIELVELLHSYGAEYSYEIYFDFVQTIEKESVEKDENCEELLELVMGD